MGIKWAGLIRSTEKLLEEREPEINELVWLSKHNFLGMITDQYISEPSAQTTNTNKFSVDNINSRRIYDRVSTFLAEALNCIGDFTLKLYIYINVVLPH